MRAVANLPALGHTLADSGGPGFSRLVWKDSQCSNQLASRGHSVACSWSRVGSETTNAAQKAERGLWPKLTPGAHLPLFPALWFSWSCEVVIKAWLRAIPQSTLRPPDRLGRGGNSYCGCQVVVGTSTPSAGSERTHPRPPNPKPQRAPHPHPTAFWNV